MQALPGLGRPGGPGCPLRIGDRDGGEQAAGGAQPACAGAELIAVAVSGATVIASPSPKTTTAGST